MPLIKGLKRKQSLGCFSTNGGRDSNVTFLNQKNACGSEVYVENSSLKAYYPPTAT